MSSLKDQHRYRSVDPKTRPPRPVQQPAPRLPKGVDDIRKTKEYKAAARRWTTTIVGLPIVMYTSWILYERLYGGKSPKRLGDLEQKD
ncbi:unnamed protein product [Penicillium nalgiovense]|uniref:Uncharacterized protein n=1 Tax=Penicillium nalgiovense TaxID=60175 RepID=A0A1V6XVE0_PENNA|nr:hypothetical protein PENNAL_c0053G03559 [Penicillium nalgiovense]CAG7963319.1 unnamed protein product [Penicillium nalgiovense]CAG7982370.1 unnamed protein product [Penicillium nalgiovense]CAG8023056.1 unnamed protein product [Penicillium nalgiovense]CAG8023622.1 unnamed protein product [Penicillium nalgiovense]